MIEYGIATRGFYILMDARVKLLAVNPLEPHGEGPNLSFIQAYAARNGWRAVFAADFITFWPAEGDGAEANGTPAAPVLPSVG